MSATCQEDEPCWDWATMGNHRIGGHDQPQPTDIAHCLAVGGEPIWNAHTLLLSCESQAPRTLPTTGATSTTMVGGAGIVLALGAICSIFARRGAVR